MKPTFIRRYHRRPSSTREAGMFKKENRLEQSFFGGTLHDPFFKPANVQPVQLKCKNCEDEDKQVKRAEDKKEEEKKVLRKTEEEEKVQKYDKEGRDEDKVQKAEKSPDREEEKIQKREKRREEEEKVQKKETGVSSSSAAGTYIKSLHGQGNPLPAQVNDFFAPKMGYDFGDVKIHTGKQAADSAEELNAKAYTVGNDIVFNEGQYNTGTMDGKKLIAHELTHVVQQKNEEPIGLQRMPDQEEESGKQVALPSIYLEGTGSQIQNTTHNANCEGVSVSGSTTANYSSSFSSSGTPQLATNCLGCTGTDCISISGNFVSVFTANPVVSLPPVPSGLNKCEQAAVRNFINTTLNQHELQHVAAFNTYKGTVVTPYNYKGCSADLQSYIQNIHDGIETARRTTSDNASAALDANGANVFTITCDCPDPEPDAGKK
jgi:hypothetical protein